MVNLARVMRAPFLSMLQTLSTAQSSYNGMKLRKACYILAFCGIVACIVILRLIALDSDAYARLSWSTGLLTDEGFYMHNARNTIVFGHPRTDGWNNMLIMPVLHVVQVNVFSLIGAGRVQTRLISVVCSFLCLIAFYSALNRAFGRRVALLGVTFLGLDHVNLLYNRLGLMDTPGVLFIVGAFWCYVTACMSASRSGRMGWFAACGIVLGIDYGVRGLVGIIWPVPVIILSWPTIYQTFYQSDSKIWTRIACFRISGGAEWILVGLAMSMTLYIVVWWYPHKQELAHYNSHYLHKQLLPRSPINLAQNIGNALVSWERGLAPYLIKHTPVQFLLVLIWLYEYGRKVLSLRKSSHLSTGYNDTSINSDNAHDNLMVSGGADLKNWQISSFLAGWLVAFLMFLAAVSYSPSRYYVLFYPAMAGLAALKLNEIYLNQKPHRVATVIFAIWFAINTAWTTDWLTHLSYNQKAADRWLADNLPKDSVLIGAVAPGLCLDNRLCAVSFIDGLCNYDHPVEKFAPAPRYIVIIDDKEPDRWNRDRWKEQWWVHHYPAFVNRSHRIHTFTCLLRCFFVIGLYRVEN